MDIKIEFGKKIRRMRQNRGLTQEELAEAIDISQRALSAIERGENFVTSDTINKLLPALNTTLEELFATSHLRNTEELLFEINNNINKILPDKKKLELLYDITQSLLKE